MKKIFLLLIPALALTGCIDRNTNSLDSGDVDTSSLKIICPTGAPAFAFYNHANNDNFETNNVPSNIVAMLSPTSDKDIVVIDTVSGIKAINNGAPYKLAANITLGNFFIGATGNDADGTMDPDDKIVIFGEHQTPDLLFHYLYGNTYDEGIEYVTNVQDAAKCLITGKNIVTESIIDYVFVAQPVLFKALRANPNASKYVDIQAKYNEVSGGKSLIQASVFIKDSLSKAQANAFLSTLESDITKAISNPDIIKDELSKNDADEMLSLYGVEADVATAVLKDNNGLGLGYKNALNNKDHIDSFISLFSLENTNEEIYYK